MPNAMIVDVLEALGPHARHGSLTMVRALVRSYFGVRPASPSDRATTVAIDLGPTLATRLERLARLREARTGYSPAPAELLREAIGRGVHAMMMDEPGERTVELDRARAARRPGPRPV